MKSLRNRQSEAVLRNLVDEEYSYIKLVFPLIILNNSDRKLEKIVIKDLNLLMNSKDIHKIKENLLSFNEDVKNSIRFRNISSTIPLIANLRDSKKIMKEIAQFSKNSGIKKFVLTLKENGWFTPQAIFLIIFLVFFILYLIFPNTIPIKNILNDLFSLNH